MREEIEKKLEEVIKNILTKDAKDITYSEYKILDSKLANIRWEEEKEKSNKEMSELMTRMLTKTSAYPTSLPEPKEV